jgi:hypothetical protein
VALAVEFEAGSVMNQAIHHGACGVVIGKDLDPIWERQVGGDADALAFVSSCDYLEEQIRRFTLKRNIPQFVNE